MAESRSAPSVPAATRNGLRAIDRARKAYHTIGRQRLEVVKEWTDDDGQPLETFASPITQADLEAIAAREPKTGYEEAVMLLVMKLRDDAGQPLFGWQDKHSLMTEVEAAIIIRLKNAIWNLSSIASVDQAKQILGEDRALAFRVRLSRLMGKSLEEVNGWTNDMLTLYCADMTMEAEEKRRELGV